MVNNSKTNLIDYIKFYFEGDYKHYNFSLYRILRIIPVILFIIAIVQIFCLEFDIGIPILNDKIAKIFLNFCYAYFASFIFYVLIEIVPRSKKQYFKNKLLKRKTRFLARSFIVLDDFLHGIILDANGSHPYKEILDIDYLLNKFSGGSGWNNNLFEFKESLNEIIKHTKDIMNLDDFIDEYLFDKLDYINNLILIILPKIEIHENNIKEREKYINNIIEIYPEIKENLLLITKDFKKEAN